MPKILYHVLTVLLFATRLFAALPRESRPPYGYQGYNLTKYGDRNSTVYETASTKSGPNPSYPEPDVFLNASVHVGEINLQVDDIRAKVNLDATVLQLLKFSAGVDASIDSVRLLIQGVEAKVLLEARLENLVLMINDVLHSIDLNPILATLGNNLNHLVNSTITGLEGPSAKGGAGGAMGGGGKAGGATQQQQPVGLSPNPGAGGAQPSNAPTSNLHARSLAVEQNILYSVNDYTGNNHMNRVFSQTGDIIDEFLDNHGNLYDRRVRGSYATDMEFTGHDKSVMHDGQVARELEYKYAPFPGLEVVSAVYVNEQQKVIGVQVLSEASGGGSSTIEGSSTR